MTSLTATQSDVLTEKVRISTIDIMRGVVMVIMAMDHIRDFYHHGAINNESPTNLATTTPLLFFTRWITHYCAPTFVLLAGTSIFLNSKRKGKKDLSLFLLTRGFWLLVLEFLVVRFGIVFNIYYDVIIFQVIWVIGASMIAMSLLIHLSYYWVLAVGLIIVFGHNISDFFRLQPGDTFFTAATFLWQFGIFNATPDTQMFVLYPLIPWLGIMLLGYCLGKLYADFDAAKRQKYLLWIGSAAVALFIIIRFINVYGDPFPWGRQDTGMFTFMSFINANKYPPSLLYTLMTIGPVLIILSLMEKINVNALKPFMVFGRVPMFYYILHFYIVHATALLFYLYTSGKSLSDIDFHFSRSFGGITPDGGYALRWTYVAWISIVLFLYPLCRWYNQYKSTHKHWWLSYL